MFLVLIKGAKMTILEKQKGEQKNGLMNIEEKIRNLTFCSIQKRQNTSGSV